MKKIKNILKKSSMILASTFLLGAIMLPANQVKAASNWWWVTHYASQAPGAYVCKVGATSNGVPIKAGVTGVSTSTRLWISSVGYYWVTAPTPSYTQTIDVWSGSGYIIPQY